MNIEDQAAGITQMAANAADALTKVAAAEAAAVVEVAAAAHSNLAPSVLVVSMFDTLQRQIEQVAQRLDAGNKWMATADQRHETMANGINTLSSRVDRQNGGVAKALEWMNAHDDRLKDEANVALGGQMVKDKARSRAEAVWAKVEKPVVYGAALLVFGFGLRLGAFFIGGPW